MQRWVGQAVPWTAALVWTEKDLEAAERLLDRKLEWQRAAKAEAEAKAIVEAEAAARQQAFAKTMVQIPGGSFQMGCSPGDGSCSGDEKPSHTVKVAAFRLGKYEVTQAQWQAVMGANPSRFKGDDRPVESVSWDDIQSFLQRLNAGASGQPYRLPTEAEWEYAARAGSKTAYWWGAKIGQGNANCDGCGSW